MRQPGDIMRRNLRYYTAALAGIALIGALMLLVMASGCTRKIYFPQTEVRTEYVHGDTAKFMAIINSLKEQISQKESKEESFIHKEWDKETFTLNQNGDTIGRDRDHGSYTSLSSKERSEYERTIESLRDSISNLKERLVSVKADSIPVLYPVERKLTAWERTKQTAGGFLLCFLAAAALVWLIVWLIKKFRK